MRWGQGRGLYPASNTTAHHLQHAGKSSQPPTSKTELTKQTQNNVLEAQGVFSKCFPPTFLST